MEEARALQPFRNIDGVFKGFEKVKMLADLLLQAFLAGWAHVIPPKLTLLGSGLHVHLFSFQSLKCAISQDPGSGAIERLFSWMT